jgi:ATP-dependent Clp protease ATP-binding subunit ClpA
VSVLKRSRRSRVQGARPAERYLAAGAAEARRRGHGHVGTGHVLAALIHDPGSSAVRLITQLGSSAAAVDAAVACHLSAGPAAPARIDPDALATLGIDFGAVRARLERTFGPGALERSHAGCLGISPRLKLSLADAVQRAAGRPLDDAHVLVGMLGVPESLAARVLATVGITLARAEAAASRA